MKLQITRLLFSAAFLFLGLQLSAQSADRSNLSIEAPIEGSITSNSSEAVVVSLSAEYALEVGDLVALNREVSTPNQIEKGFVTVGTFRVESLNGSNLSLKPMETKDLKMAANGEKVNKMTSGMQVKMSLLTSTH